MFQALARPEDRAHGTASSPADGCLHYYFYFIDEQLGLGLHARAHLAALPAASLLQPARLAGQSIAHARRIPHGLADNTFVSCGDWAKAQALVTSFREIKVLGGPPARPGRGVLPVVQTVSRRLPLESHAGGVCAGRGVQARRRCLRPVYQEISRQAIFTVKAPDTRPVPEQAASSGEAERRRGATFIRASKARASNTSSTGRRSRCMTRPDACCAWNA